jgi:hypothetical protein
VFVEILHEVVVIGRNARTNTPMFQAKICDAVWLARESGFVMPSPFHRRLRIVAFYLLCALVTLYRYSSIDGLALPIPASPSRRITIVAKAYCCGVATEQNRHHSAIYTKTVKESEMPGGMSCIV